MVNIQKGEKREKTRYVLQVIFSIISLGSIIYVYFVLFEKELFVTIGVALWMLWGILGTIYHIISFNKRTNVTIEKVSSVRHLTLPDPNKPVSCLESSMNIKITDSSVGQRCDLFLLSFLHENGYENLTRSFLQNNWKDLVKVNGKDAKPSLRLRRMLQLR